VQAQMLSLPKILGTTPDTIPAQIPYIFSDRSFPKQFRAEDRSQLKIGIVWASGYRAKRDSLRFYHTKSCPLSLFMQLLTIPTVSLYSLQVGKDADEIDRFLVDRVHNLSDRIQDFADTANWIEQLDLVIAVDTAVVHLAGAMGKPVWVMLPFAPDWRWMLEREDTPWYPTMRLFRQQRSGDWEEVWSRIMSALKG